MIFSVTNKKVFNIGKEGFNGLYVDANVQGSYTTYTFGGDNAYLSISVREMISFASFYNGLPWIDTKGI